MKPEEEVDQELEDAHPKEETIVSGSLFAVSGGFWGSSFFVCVSWGFWGFGVSVSFSFFVFGFRGTSGVSRSTFFTTVC
jgi:hypothetical protein